MRKCYGLLIGLISFCVISCASLQQDVHTYTEVNNFIYTSIEIYENQFIQIDAKYHLEEKAPVEEINTLLTDITSYRNSTNVTEPFLQARLRAFEGLLNKMLNKNHEAQTCWQEAHALQKGDSYEQLLESRLIKNQEEALLQIEGILTYDPKNAILLLEKGKLFYRLQKYDQAVAAMDNAFILFDSEGLPDYREIYSPLRNNAWDLNKLSSVPQSSILNGVTLPDPLTRRFCASFIWNAWVRKNGNLKMFTRYSDKYKKSGRTKSPVADVPLEDVDFDAILGVIENEFMELPDGRNFYPDEEVTSVQFLTWIKNADL